MLARRNVKLPEKEHRVACLIERRPDVAPGIGRREHVEGRRGYQRGCDAGKREEEKGAQAVGHDCEVDHDREREDDQRAAALRQ